MKRHLLTIAIATLVPVHFSSAANVFQMPAGLRSLELVTVDDPGNSADDTGYGAVSYTFQMGKFEVTAAQYVEFLNAKGKSTPDGTLWFNDMVRAPVDDAQFGCNIVREGEMGSYTYRVAADFANRPVTHVSFWDACRFCNWLHNGQGDGDTETGAYDLKGYNGTDGRRARRNTNAKWFLPNDNEWYKAAYYDPERAGGAGYWDYPTRSDTKPGRGQLDKNSANFYSNGFLDPKTRLTEVGWFAHAASPYGTFDQAGNLYEWTEGLKPPFLRSLWGGSWGSEDAGRNASAVNLSFSSKSDNTHIGFRIAGRTDWPEESGSAAAATSSAPERVPTDFPRRPWRDPQTGKPFFPLAWYSYNSDEQDLEELARDGANLVLYINSPSDVDTEESLNQNLPQMLKYLDHAQKCGMKVHVQLASWYGAYLNHAPDMVDRQRRWVEGVCHHPALFGYQLYDEPEYRAGGGLGVEDQKALSDLVQALQQNRDNIRQWDRNPDHAIQVVFNLVPLSSWTAYLPTIDSFQVDRYPCDATQAFFGHQGDWGPLYMAWSMGHGVEALRDMPHLRNPSPCMQGVGSAHTESNQLGLWRNPLYEETRYMAYSSLTVGSWGIFHWIRNFGHPNSNTIMRNVARLYHELRQLVPAFEQSFEHPPFTVRHNHEQITRDFLTDSVLDITTLALEDSHNYYLIASDNSAVFTDVQFRMKLPHMQGTTEGREAHVLNEDWSRQLTYDASTQEWQIAAHNMCFGDINVWVIPKALETTPESTAK